MAKTTVPVNIVNEEGRNGIAVMAKVVAALSLANLNDMAKQYKEDCNKATSFDDIMKITNDYVEVISM